MKITRLQLREIIKEATNYASLPHQGMPTLRKVIQHVIRPEDVYQVIDQLLSYDIPQSSIDAAAVSHELVLPIRDYHEKIISVLKNNHPSVYGQLVGQRQRPYTDRHPIVHHKKPQEIDLRRITLEIQKIYNDEFISNYISRK